MEIRIQDNSAAFIAALRRQGLAALDKIGKKAVKYAQQDLRKAKRVDTGALLNSIQYKVVLGEVYIGTNSPYASFHELGTGHYTAPHAGESYGVSPVHFIFHAAGRHTAEYRKILIREMRNA